MHPLKIQIQINYIHMKKVILFVVCVLLVQLSSAQWAGMGTGPGGKVRALCVHGGELYAGGDFTGLVKKWNGSSWVAVGSLSGSTSPKVNALISYNGSLYAGGAFSLSASNYNVAKWNGSAWVAVGEGLAGVAGSEVKAFCIFNGGLYAGGTFTQSGTSSLAKVAKLNSGGTAWAQVGGGAPSKCQAGVYAMCVYYNEFYVGGQGSAPWINKLNVGGTAWIDLASGGLQSGTGVYALTSFKYPNATTYSLFIGGDFAQPPSSTVCTYYGGFWGTAVSTFSAGATDQVNCFVASSSGSSGVLYAGGQFTVTGIHSATNIAKKTITTPWDTAGSNSFNLAVRAMCFYNGYLVAGGDFTSPGSYVARYATTVDVEEISDNIITNDLYPNPVTREALLKVQTKTQMLHPEFRMLDLNGNEVGAHADRTLFNRSQNEVAFTISREGLAAGIYYYMVIDEERPIATGKIVVE